MSRLYPDRPFLAASVAVFREGRVLLGARTAAPNPQAFSLPGGVVELGETVEQAALRELAEETGVVAELVDFAAHTQVFDRDEDGRVRRHFVVMTFAAHWISGEGEPSEEAPELIWANPDDLGALKTTPNLQRVLAAARLVIERRNGT
ncbi:MAG: NUDIX hydrolase [Beijerinckiaceae bacterium]|jgi:8-oxo-dGTP diphosphatase|nr:NUDIX hydrolase [Beijerinckiaceae bacterium]MDO9443371.1 NUDIX hydrolase [Beijerinckiaceae bacterium]